MLFSHTRFVVVIWWHNIGLINDLEQNIEGLWQVFTDTDIQQNQHTEGSIFCTDIEIVRGIYKINIRWHALQVYN